MALYNFNPLTPELPSSHSMGPQTRSSQTQYYFKQFFFGNFQAGILALREFVTVGEASFSASLGERVNCSYLTSLHFKGLTQISITVFTLTDKVRSPVVYSI